MEFQIIQQLILAIFLGALIGLEREYKGKGAGLQTYSLVCLGACLFTIISLEMIDFFSSKELGTSSDIIRIVNAIAIGIGFIGAGVIFRQESGIIGLTTAAGLWVTAGIGISVGAGLYFLAAFSALLSLLVLSGFGLLEDKLLKSKR